jgi:hypothetical protein
VFVVGKPIDGPLPPGYTGPIVVVHCGDDEEEEEYYYDQDELLNKAEIVAAADGASGDGVGASGSRSSGSSNGSESNYKEREGGGLLRWPQIAIALPEVMETEEPVREEQITTGSEETEVVGSLSSSGELDATLSREERREPIPTLQAAGPRPSNP